MLRSTSYKCIVLGVSAGGMVALPQIIFSLPKKYPIPIVIVQHLHPNNRDGFLAHYLNEKCQLHVKEIEEKEMIKSGFIYLAPADYHAHIEKEYTFSLSIDQKVNFARPSIDVLFESAAEVYHSQLIGIILTGANSDGATGLKHIKENGGLTIVQEPSTAIAPQMPNAAIQFCQVDHVMPIEQISKFLVDLMPKMEVEKCGS